MRRRYFPKIEMSFWFFLGLSLFLLFDQGNLGSMCVAAVLLHELFHLLEEQTRSTTGQS